MSEHEREVTGQEKPEHAEEERTGQDSGSPPKQDEPAKPKGVGETEEGKPEAAPADGAETETTGQPSAETETGDAEAGRPDEAASPKAEAAPAEAEAASPEAEAASPEAEAASPEAEAAPAEAEAAPAEAEAAPAEAEAASPEAEAASPEIETPPQEQKQGSVHVRKRGKEVYVADVKSGQPVSGVFMALRKNLPMDRTGKRFLAVTLADRTGRLESRLWDGAEQAAERFGISDYVRIKGNTHNYHGRLQVRIETIEPVNIRDLGLPPSEFISESSQPADKMLEELSSIVDGIKSGHLKTLVRSFLNDPKLGALFKRAPAAQSIHHAWIGGLLEHTLSVMRLCQRMCDHYPQVDRDLVMAGAFLHDFGKVEELSYDDTLGYTDAGKLVGHLVLCCQWISEHAARIPGFPRSLLDRLVHIVISHHGQMEYGSPIQPHTLEALVVHSADELDARMASWSELLESAGPDGWTEFSRTHERQLFRGSPAIAPAPQTGAPAKKKRRRRRKSTGASDASPQQRRKSGGPVKGKPSPEPARAKPETAVRSGGPRKRGRAEDESGRRGAGKSSAAKEKKPTLTFNPFADKLKEKVEPSEEAAPEKPSEPPQTEPTKAPAEQSPEKEPGSPEDS